MVHVGTVAFTYVPVAQGVVIARMVKENLRILLRGIPNISLQLAKWLLPL
eukprot:m.390123 g.390123  ORF g.390123 m.390123 type:complete len:50 (+) comp21055_c4_seq29:2170-2319(+)